MAYGIEGQSHRIHFVEEIRLPFDKCFKEMMNKIVTQLSSFIS